MEFLFKDKEGKENIINTENKLENIISNDILTTKLNNLENNFKNIKSKYILQKIFNNLEKKKSFNIIKYNKNIKKSLDININDYKEYSENYSSIEIEIKPVKNKCDSKCDQFINIKKENEGYYHIYFNNNKDEIKRNFIDKGEKIENIKIIIDYQIKSFESLFENCCNIESINFKKFYEFYVLWLFITKRIAFQ